ncbi:hypothetical protein OESDEN_07535 [Oesophagostomum dentatum]|uniref:Uncharacterized protein n=1 Tax=Oesophagostomum dentatum TaxID=61180 RepID=A0A0B1T9V0_OESDE|nr:hypothetical protein OESDEN_07535 [Oesophagostomum dentatum]
MNFLLPKRYVTEGENPGDPFDLGIWNLETAIKEDEERVDKITKRRRRFEDDHKAGKHSRNCTLDRFEEPDERVDPW